MNEIYYLCGSIKTQCTSYHQQTNAQVERLNRTIISSISIYALDNQVRNWDRILPFTLLSYRSSIHPSTLETPFYLTYGRDIILPIDLSSTLPDPLYVEVDDYKYDVAMRLKYAWNQARINIENAQTKQKVQHDKKQFVPNFQVGSIVYLYCPVAKPGNSRKFVARWHGPQRISELVGTHNAKIIPLSNPRKRPQLVNLDRLKLSVEPRIVELPITENSSSTNSRKVNLANSNQLHSDSSTDDSLSSEL